MKKFLFIIALFSIISCKNQEGNIKGSVPEEVEVMNQASIHQFKVTDINGKEFDFASLKGKKVMIVNTASKCSLAPQYEQLETLYEEFKKDNFIILGFPANNFNEQEPGTNAEIAEFCTKNYGVTFPMMEKISVKGADMHPLYQFLTQKAQNGLQENNVEWNFQKYLIDREGHLDRVVAPQTLPIDESIINWIKKA
ncbi:glutathione peroxidase [Flavobacterium sp.]|uniref:glutathione peroxidase n=1 Tax=Flavobacterium sp. TaxID=239 RepID=UPI00286A25AB|nr:glutathione peroxidase [Flavobacterium sp.]